MPILAIFTSIGAHPVEAIFAVLDSIDEVPACNDRVRHLANFCSRVRVNIDIRLFRIIHRQVMTVLALLALLTHPSFVVAADCFLVVDYTKLPSFSKTQFELHLLSPSAVV